MIMSFKMSLLLIWTFITQIILETGRFSGKRGASEHLSVENGKKPL